MPIVFGCSAAGNCYLRPIEIATLVADSCLPGIYMAGSKMKCNTVVMLSVEALYGQRIQAVSG